MGTLDQIPAAAKAFTSSVKVLGPVTVAFFVLLGFLIYLNASAITTLTAVSKDQANQLDRIEGKIDDAVKDAKEGNELQKYLLRQVCYNTARTDQDKNACNPPPTLRAL